jgi:hypothetical protein
VIVWPSHPAGAKTNRSFKDVEPTPPPISSELLFACLNSKTISSLLTRAARQDIFCGHVHWRNHVTGLSAAKKRARIIFWRRKRRNSIKIRHETATFSPFSLVYRVILPTDFHDYAINKAAMFRSWRGGLEQPKERAKGQKTRASSQNT